MAGLAATCAQVQEELEEHIENGAVLSERTQQHLLRCQCCQAHLSLLKDVQMALLEEVSAVSPPPALKHQILEAARKKAQPQSESLTKLPEVKKTQPSTSFVEAVSVSSQASQRQQSKFGQRWWSVILGAAAVTGLLFIGGVLGPSSSRARTLPDPAVVVNMGQPFVVASNDRYGTISVVQDGKVTSSIRSGGQNTAWFTEGVRLGDRVYLADAANDRVLEIRAKPLNIMKVYAVPNGIAGLTASSDNGGQVFFKSVRGAVGLLKGKHITIAQEKDMPLLHVMDAVLLAGNSLFVTHHVSGEVCLLDPQSLSVQKRLKVGGSPVALASVRDGVLVLDVQGKLLQLDLQGTLVRSWKIPGTPDKLSVNGEVAVLTDRNGPVTRIHLKSGVVSQTKLTYPMDVTQTSDGRFAVAEGGSGFRVLDDQLRTRSWIERQY